MKKIIFCMVIALLACVSVNAQNVINAVSEDMAVATENVEETVATEAVAEEIVVSPEVAAELARPTLLTHSMVAGNNDDYKSDSKWRSAKKLRTAGIIMTAVGGASAILYGAMAIESLNSDNLAGVLFTGPAATGVAIVGGVVAIAGGIMWAVGNSKMKKARLAFNGNGLAYTF